MSKKQATSTESGLAPVAQVTLLDGSVSGLRHVASWGSIVAVRAGPGTEPHKGVQRGFRVHRLYHRRSDHLHRAWKALPQDQRGHDSEGAAEQR